MFPHSPRAKEPGMPIHLRHPDTIDTKDIEQAPLKYNALALIHLRNEIERLANLIVDRSRPVDEYNVQTLVAEALPQGNQLILQPQFETGEIIESIVITGPAAGTATLQLGDRAWPIVIPASQILFIGAPLVLGLSRNDNRILTATTSGEWSLELMGYADTRGQLV